MQYALEPVRTNYTRQQSQVSCFISRMCSRYTKLQLEANLRLSHFSLEHTWEVHAWSCASALTRGNNTIFPSVSNFNVSNATCLAQQNSADGLACRLTPTNGCRLTGNTQPRSNGQSNALTYIKSNRKVMPGGYQRWTSINHYVWSHPKPSRTTGMNVPEDKKKVKLGWSNRNRAWEMLFHQFLRDKRFSVSPGDRWLCESPTERQRFTPRAHIDVMRFSCNHLPAMESRRKSTQHESDQNECTLSQQRTQTRRKQGLVTALILCSNGTSAWKLTYEVFKHSSWFLRIAVLVEWPLQKRRVNARTLRQMIRNDSKNRFDVWALRQPPEDFFNLRLLFRFSSLPFAFMPCRLT